MFSTQSRARTILLLLLPLVLLLPSTSFAANGRRRGSEGQTNEAKAGREDSRRSAGEQIANPTQSTPEAISTPEVANPHKAFRLPRGESDAGNRLQPMGRPSLQTPARPVEAPVAGEPGQFTVPRSGPHNDNRVREHSEDRPLSPYRIYAPPENVKTPQAPERVYRTEPLQREVDGRNASPYTPPTRRVEPKPALRTPERDLERGNPPQLDQERVRNRRAPPDNDNRIGGTERPVPSRGERLLKVPEADFRGPESDHNVRLIRREDRQRSQDRLRERLSNHNNSQERPTRERLIHDTVGNAIPADLTVISRDHLRQVGISYGRIRRSFGRPNFQYVVAPRSRLDYWDGYWDGYADGYWAGRHRWHGSHVVISFYYGYYWSDPYWFAFYYPGYYPSIYHYWGWCPGWLYPNRVYYVPTEYVYIPATPYRYYYATPYVDEIAARRVVEDTRRAWFESDIATLSYHLTDQLDIRVYFDGKYEYSTTTEDYYAMTVDAMATTHTVAMDFDTPIWLSTHEFFVTGRHVFYDPAENRQTVYVSYRFRNLGGEWYLVAVGTSLEPIQHQYRDFRYS